MTICHLSQEETQAFEQYNIQPNCAHHHHLSVKKAMQLLSSNLIRPVGDKEGLCAAVDQSSNNREWKKRISGGQACMQLVRIVGG